MHNSLSINNKNHLKKENNINFNEKNITKISVIPSNKITKKMHNSCSNVNENKLNIENFVILEKEKLSDNRSSFKEKSSIDKMTSIVHSRFYR